VGFPEAGIVTIRHEKQVSSSWNNRAIRNRPFERRGGIIAKEKPVKTRVLKVRIVKLDPIGIIFKIDDIGKRPGIGGHEFVDTNLT
jgi:hypothetical protein